jgi:hypothetical protein
MLGDKFWFVGDAKDVEVNLDIILALKVLP